MSRTIAVVILLALLGGSWLGRSWLDDQWDSLYETIERWTGDDDTPQTSQDDPPQTAQGSESLFTGMDLPGVQTVEYQDSPENRDFLKWERAHSEQLDTLSENVLVSTLETDPTNSGSPAEAAHKVATVAAPVRELLELVDTAPDSQLRTAAVTVFMQMLHAFELLERAFLESSLALFRDADAAAWDLAVTMTAYNGFAEESIIFGP